MHGFSARRACGATVVLAVALMACGREAETGHRYPGALAKPIDAYSGDELYELTRRLRFTGSHERERRCRDVRGCAGTTPLHRTLVQVSGVATQDSVGPATVPRYGVVYARAINRGDATEARYGMRPDSTLHYYLVVAAGSTGTLTWRLEELDTAPPRRHVTVATGRIQSCGHRWRSGAQADFRSCDQPDPADSLGMSARGLQRTALDDPIWIQCDQGCCQALQ